MDRALESAMLTCDDGNRREVYSKPVALTDLPEPGVRFYYAGWAIYLPSEY